MWAVRNFALFVSGHRVECPCKPQVSRHWKEPGIDHLEDVGEGPLQIHRSHPLCRPACSSARLFSQQVVNPTNERFSGFAEGEESPVQRLTESVWVCTRTMT